MTTKQWIVGVLACIAAIAGVVAATALLTSLGVSPPAALLAVLAIPALAALLRDIRTKPCPWCNQTVGRNDIACRHCGRPLRPKPNSP